MKELLIVVGDYEDPGSQRDVDFVAPSLKRRHVKIYHRIGKAGVGGLGSSKDLGQAQTRAKKSHAEGQGRPGGVRIRRTGKYRR